MDRDEVQNFGNRVGNLYIRIMRMEKQLSCLELKELKRLLRKKTHISDLQVLTRLLEVNMPRVKKTLRDKRCTDMDLDVKKFIYIYYYMDVAIWRNKQNSIIIKPPGLRLNVISEFIYSKRTYERIFHPAIMDMQSEYFEALYEDRAWKARWVRVRGTWSFWAAAVMQVPVSSSKLIRKIWTLVG